MKSNKKKILPIIILIAAVTGTVVVGSNKSSEQQLNTYSLKKLTAEELMKLPSKSLDKGVITEYKVPSLNTFEVTYVNEQGKVQMVKVKNLYMIGKVEKEEGSKFVKKVISSEDVTEDQLYMIAHSLTESNELANDLIKSVKDGSEVTIGFVVKEEDKEMNVKEAVIEEANDKEVVEEIKKENEKA